MVCERCGNDMSDNASICPMCGTVSARAKATAQPSTGYGQYPQSPFGAPPTYQQGYAPQPDASPLPQATKVPPL
ncbi:MAG: zinc-ribbon domain-containing protein, partial [Chloroflexi bacterium]|nr:zinc-ribbon domain-containing protein [Chloroflexota bacterium]